MIEKIFSVKYTNSNNKIHNVVRILGFKIKFKKKLKRDFSLNSGERQVAQTTDGIRRDHLCRYEMAINEIQKNCGNRDALRLLDIFCGNGYGSFILSQKFPDSKILGIDASKEAIKFAIKYYKKHNNIKFKQKFFPFKVKKDTYDAIISLESIEHIEDDMFFLKTLISALKENGVLILSTPNDAQMPLKLNPNPYHFRHYLKEDFIKTLNEHGLSVIKIYGQDAYKIENLYVKGILNEKDMDLKENYDGQFVLYVCQKAKG